MGGIAVGQEEERRKPSINAEEPVKSRYEARIMQKQINSWRIVAERSRINSVWIGEGGHLLEGKIPEQRARS